MMDALIRRGLYALPAGGVLTLLPWLVMGPNPRITDVAGYARYLASTRHVLAGYVYVAGLLCLLFGILALYSHLARMRAASTAAGGMILSVIGAALMLPIFGVVGLADSVLGHAYVAGHTGVSAGFTQMVGGHFASQINTHFLLFFLISLVGPILNGVAMWQSASVPKATAISIAVGVLVSVTITPLVVWIGALCLIAGGLWLTQAVYQLAPGVASSAAAGQPSGMRA